MPIKPRDPVDLFFGLLPGFIAVNVLGASFINGQLGWDAHSPSSLMMDSLLGAVEQFQVQLPYAVHGVLVWAQTEAASRLLCSIVAVYMLYLVARGLWAPMTYMRGVTDVQFPSCAAQRERQPYEAMLRRGRRLGDMPAPFPNGWFMVSLSRDLRKGDVKQLNVLGHSLVLFRTEDSGRACVTDAYCPHLGANLAVGGKVKGDCIECPFHGWTFDGASGECASIPYSKQQAKPASANVRAWPVHEQSGMVLLWHDAEGREPQFPPMTMPEVDAGYKFHGKTEHVISNVLRDVPENGFDQSHLGFLHEPFIIPALGGLLKHQWEADCAVHPSDPYKTQIKIVEKVCLFGRPLTFADVHVVVNQWGPGCVVLRFALPVGEVVIIETVTPVEPMLLKATHAIWAPWYVPRFVAKLVLNAVAIQFERDVPIWNNKRSVKNPVLVAEDKGIKTFRRWFQQFYSPASLSFEAACESFVKLDW